MHQMDDIERLTRTYAEHRQALADRMAACEDEVRTVKRRHLRGIRAAVDRVASARQTLADAIDTSRPLFARRRTRIFHAVRVGLMKGKGGLLWENDAAVVRLIRKHFPEHFDALVKVSEKPVKSALANLTASELKRLGVHIVDADDEVFIKVADSDIDRLVDALLSDELEDAA